MNSRITIPIFVPHKGCPNDCYFCNQRRITGFIEEMTPERARGIIEEYLGFCEDSKRFEIAFFGGSFTAIPEEKRRALLEVAKEYIDGHERIDYAHISTRPDCIDDEILDELKAYGVRIIELGVQSLDEEVLRQSNRGHDVACVYRSAGKIREKGFLLGLQMMTGLKADTAQKSLDTARKFVLLRPDMVRIYPTLVIKDTVFERQLQSGEYRPWSLEETIDVVKRCKVLFERNGIRVIRMGLQPSDTVQSGSSVVDGPFHAAFGELVYTAMYRDFLEQVLFFDRSREYERDAGGSARDKGGLHSYTVTVNRREISKWVGEKRSTCEYFRLKYGEELRFIPHEEETVIIEEKEYRPEEVIEDLYRTYAL
ncbi:MAG: radical SAM protein [Filifactor alocis]|nr:radical SAM protein [Filifactor alocis]